MRLYEISAKYLEALDAATDPDNPLSADGVMADTLEGLEGDLQEKLFAVIGYAQGLKAEAAAIKDVVTRTQERQRTKEKQADSLIEYAKVQMSRVGLDFIERSDMRVKLANSPPAVIVDEALLPSEYWVVKEVRNPNKIAIAEVLKAGYEIPGAELRVGKRLVIK